MITEQAALKLLTSLYLL